MFNNNKVPEFETPERPPKPNPPPKQPCQHKWVFQRSDYDYRYNTYGNSEYKRYDTYYCEKCLEIKEVLAKYECSRERPYWYKE